VNDGNTVTVAFILHIAAISVSIMAAELS